MVYSFFWTYKHGDDWGVYEIVLTTLSSNHEGFNHHEYGGM
jgi:hypothetical protein